MRPRGHLSCSACRLRLRADSPAVALLEGRCPICAATLHANASASEVLGFRSFDLGALSAAGAEDQPGSAIDPGQLRDRRETARTQDTQDAGRWSDDGGRIAGQAVARRPAPQ